MDAILSDALTIPYSSSNVESLIQPIGTIWYIYPHLSSKTATHVGETMPVIWMAMGSCFAKTVPLPLQKRSRDDGVVRRVGCGCHRVHRADMETCGCHVSCNGNRNRWIVLV